MGLSGKVTRRQLLVSGLVSGAGVVGILEAVRRMKPLSEISGRPWSSVRVGSSDRLAIRSGTTVVLDQNAVVAGLDIEPGATLIFDPSASRSLISTGNVVVRGRLVMKPNAPELTHTLRFVGIDESKFRGGTTHVPLAQDVGLWVVDRGQLDLAGTGREAWNRRGESPTWRPQDELVVTPTSAGDETIRPFRQGGVLPSVNGWKAEVLNLTRNVRIEGTPQGRAHIFIHSSEQQVLRNVAIRYLGPRRSRTTATLGRYALHFHDCGDGSRGSLVDSVVARDCGNHSFVPHMSNAITFRQCIAHRVEEEAFWWDVPDSSNDILWDRCVAAGVTRPPDADGFHVLAGFVHGHGDHNAATGCVSVGVAGGATSSGFHWPSQHAVDAGIWTFRDCVAHNNSADGIFVWQNTGKTHLIDRFSAFHNGKAGIEHGAYRNPYRYRNVKLYANGRPRRSGVPEAQLVVHAVSGFSGLPARLSFEQVTMDGGGIGRAGLLIKKHSLDAENDALFAQCHILGFEDRAVIVDDMGRAPGSYSFVDCAVGSERRSLRPGDFRVVSMNARSLIRVTSEGSSFEVRADSVTPAS